MYIGFLCTTVHIEIIIFSKWYSTIINLYISTTVNIDMYVITLSYVRTIVMEYSNR